MPETRADLLLVGRVITADPARPRAGAVAIAGGRIVAVGEASEMKPLRGPRTEVLGGPRAVIVPGFVDAHLHFLALARRGGEVDCSIEVVRTVEDILARVRGAAREAPPGSWILGFGVDEFFLAERRRPRLSELDRAAPLHPVRLLHRTGHAAMLNTAAMRAARLDELAGDPRIERNAQGKATGLIYEQGTALRGRIPRPDVESLERQVMAASERLASVGVTTFHDPTPGYGEAELASLCRWAAAGTVWQRVRSYGSTFVPSAPEIESRFAARGIKVMAEEGSDANEVSLRVARADREGAQVAIHAVEHGPLVIAVDALGRLGPERVRRRGHRIEHAALVPPGLVGALAASGATVVTHPDFLARFGEKYRSAVPAVERDWLYPLRSFCGAKIPVALGSDAPIAPAGPLSAIAAAADRRDSSGERIAGAEAIPAERALVLHTRGGAAAGGDADSLGVLAEGRHGDAVILGDDPTEVPAAEIASIPIEATVVGGRAWFRA